MQPIAALNLPPGSHGSAQLPAVTCRSRKMSCHWWGCKCCAAGKCRRPNSAGHRVSIVSVVPVCKEGHDLYHPYNNKITPRDLPLKESISQRIFRERSFPCGGCQLWVLHVCNSWADRRSREPTWLLQLLSRVHWSSSLVPVAITCSWVFFLVLLLLREAGWVWYVNIAACSSFYINLVAPFCFEDILAQSNKIIIMFSFSGVR